MNDIKTWAERSFADNSKQLVTAYMQAEIAELRAALAARATPAQPVGYVLFTGHGDKFSREKPKCEIDYWKPVYLESSRASPSSVGAAIRALPLPEPLEIDWPQLNSNALGCGVEDRNIRDRYEAAEYGWQDGVDKAAERVPDDIYTADQVRALLSEAAALAEQVQGQKVTGKPVAWHVTYGDGDCEHCTTERRAKQVARELEENGWLNVVIRPVSYTYAAPSSAQDGQQSEGA